jgi:hypothetical protein
MAIGERFAGFAVAHGRRAGLVTAMAGGLFASGLAGAPGASALTFVHSAKSGELRGGRLILRGVNDRVTYFTSAGGTATAKVKRVHKGVFLPGRPATGVLHVEGHQGGDEPSFKLTSPRYNAARRTVSFKARRLDSKQLPTGAVGTVGIARPRSLSAASSKFGPASLTVTSHPTVAIGSGNECIAHIVNSVTDYYFADLAASSWEAWDTDSWERLPPTNGPNPPAGISQGDVVHPRSEDYWESRGGDLRGCHNKVIFRFAQGPDTFTIEQTWPWGNGPSSTCTPANTPYKCTQTYISGQVFWTIGR